MPAEMARPGAGGGRRHERRLGGGELARLPVEPPNKGAVQAEVVHQHPLPGRVGRDHVRVRPVVVADGEVAGRAVGRAAGTGRPPVPLHVNGVAKPAVRLHRQHRDVAAAVVGHEHEAAGRMHAGLRRAGPL